MNAIHTLCTKGKAGVVHKARGNGGQNAGYSEIYLAVM
jgi:hypothetical protein